MQTIKIQIPSSQFISRLENKYYRVFIPVFFLYTCRKYNADDIITLLKYIIESIELIFTYNYKKYFYLILPDSVMNYKEQILIINIKANL